MLWVKCTVLPDQKLTDIIKVFVHFYDILLHRKHISHICSSTGILITSFADAFFNCEQQNDQAVFAFFGFRECVCVSVSYHNILL